MVDLNGGYFIYHNRGVALLEIILFLLGENLRKDWGEYSDVVSLIVI